MEPTVLAETDDLLVLNKPAGLIVHSDGRTKEPTVAQWILTHYPALISIGKPWVSPQGESIPLPGIVHRLDRTTSGVLLVAKTQEMYAYLKHEFKERRVEKIYRAYVYGHMESAEGEIIAEICRSGTPPKKWYARPCGKDDVRAAITRWKLLGVLDDVSYLELYPKTGRTHQLRVHLSSIGHAIVGDHIYAADRVALLGFTRPALHAYSISVLLDGMRVIFTAPLPADFSL